LVVVVNNYSSVVRLYVRTVCTEYSGRLPGDASPMWFQKCPTDFRIKKIQTMSTNPNSPSNWGPEKVSRGITLATRALFCSCCAYIVAVFQAVPASLHFQISGTSIATTESQYHLGLGLAAFRIFTFLFGSGLGAATDRCGRKVW
jgi:hypothetical protein